MVDRQKLNDKVVKSQYKEIVEASMISLAKTLYYQADDITAQDIVAGIMEAMHQAQETELQVEGENTPIPDWMSRATWEKREGRKRAYDAERWGEHKSLDKGYSKMARADKRKSFETKLDADTWDSRRSLPDKKKKVKVLRICIVQTDP